MFTTPKIKTIKCLLTHYQRKVVCLIFYERNFYYSQDENSLNFKSEDEFLKNIKNYKRISVYIPGFMAFFYYSGSIFFLLFLNLILIIFLILIEKSCAFIMRHNNLFIAMFSMILIWRTIHIGLFPLNTLLFFIILTLVPFVFLILDKILLGFIKRKKIMIRKYFESKYVYNIKIVLFTLFIFFFDLGFDNLKVGSLKFDFLDARYLLFFNFAYIYL